LIRNPQDLVVVDEAGRMVDAVEVRLEESACEVAVFSMRELATLGEIHAEDGVARIEQAKERREVCAGAGVRLDVGIPGTEELGDTLDRKVLHDINVFAAAVVAFTREPLGVLVGQHRANRGQYGL